MEDKKTHINKPKTKKMSHIIEQPKDLHKLCIDEYFNNGFNMSQAVRDIKPGLSDRNTTVTAHTILNSPNNKAYIRSKHEELKAVTNVSTEQVLSELLTYVKSDATKYIGLTIDEIKDLPSDIRRCIQSIKCNTITRTDRKTGEETKTEHLEVKLIDKTRAIEMINKHIGFYSIDNEQKANKINVLQVLEKSDPIALNGLLKAIELNKG